MPLLTLVVCFSAGVLLAVEGPEGCCGEGETGEGPRSAPSLFDGVDLPVKPAGGKANLRLLEKTFVAPCVSFLTRHCQSTLSEYLVLSVSLRKVCFCRLLCGESLWTIAGAKLDQTHFVCFPQSNTFNWTWTWTCTLSLVVADIRQSNLSSEVSTEINAQRSTCPKGPFLFGLKFSLAQNLFRIAVMQDAQLPEFL